ncbi:ATP-binding protein, partial [Moorena sp. SIO3H5]|uniref:sensor histidine kinase n=1 Tax=Moorena sp. SIO3H5 TaxID=2607834 RepID=UPI0013B93846
LVECYASQLNRVFMNLLSNAIDAMETAAQLQPKITIQTAVLDDNKVAISINDCGPGIPSAIQNQIFEAFFTTKPVGKGTGLGLSISYQIVVDKHQGYLACESAPEQGTTFRIELPIRGN